MVEGPRVPMKPYLWIASRPQLDPGIRLLVHGPILPMEEEEPGFLERLFGR